MQPCEVPGETTVAANTGVKKRAWAKAHVRCARAWVLCIHPHTMHGNSAFAATAVLVVSVFALLFSDDDKAAMVAGTSAALWCAHEISVKSGAAAWM